MPRQLSILMVLTVLLFSASMVATTYGASTNSSAPTVNVTYNKVVGYYLTNSTGWTLYIYTRDTPYSGNSTCYGSCASIWPPFYVSPLTVAPGLNPVNFSVITRTGGAKQLTYDGYPLYYYKYDTAAGTTNGQGVDGTWYVASPSKSSAPVTSTTTNISATMPTTTTSGKANTTTSTQTNTSTSGTSSGQSAYSGGSNYLIYAAGGIVVVIIIIAAAYIMMHRRQAPV